MPREALEALQLKGLRRMLRRMGLSDVPSLAEVARFPFTTDAMLARRTLPARSFADRNTLAELHVDPATRLPVAATKNDLLRSAEAVARALAAAGLEKGDPCAILEPLSLAGDGLAAYHGCRKAGLFSLPLAECSPEEQVERMRTLYAKGVCASALSLLRLPRTDGPSAVRAALVSQRGLSDNLRAELTERLPFDVFAVHGLSVTGGFASLGHECRKHDGLHVNEDQFLVEVVDPQTGEPLPDGEPGELVVTAFAREAHPLLRYRTGEKARIQSRTPCPCGRTSLRLAFR